MPTTMSSLKRFYYAYTEILQRIKDCHYVIGDDDEVITSFNQFESRFKAAPYRSAFSTYAVKGDDEIVIRFVSEAKVDVPVIKETCQILEAHDIRKAILVYPNILTTMAKYVIHKISRNIEIIPLSESVLADRFIAKHRPPQQHTLHENQANYKCHDEKRKYCAVPNNYKCAACGLVGTHWIMVCPLLKCYQMIKTKVKDLLGCAKKYKKKQLEDTNLKRIKNITNWLCDALNKVPICKNSIMLKNISLDISKSAVALLLNKTSYSSLWIIEKMLKQILQRN